MENSYPKDNPYVKLPSMAVPTLYYVPPVEESNNCQTCIYCSESITQNYKPGVYSQEIPSCIDTLMDIVRSIAYSLYLPIIILGIGYF